MILNQNDRTINGACIYKKSKVFLIQEDLYQDAKTNAAGAFVYT